MSTASASVSSQAESNRYLPRKKAKCEAFVEKVVLHQSPHPQGCILIPSGDGT